MQASVWRLNVVLLFLYWFFHAFIPAYAIERLFFQARGLRVTEVVVLEIVYSAAVALLEVPLGAVADRHGRKRLMVGGAFFTCCEFGFLLAAHSLPLFLCAILAAACQKAMTSGTSNALLYDSLAALGRTDRFVPLVARLRLMDTVTTLGALAAGGWIAHRWGMELTYWVALASTSGSLVVSFFLAEAPGSGTGSTPALGAKPAWEWTAFAKPVLDAVRMFRSHGELGTLIVCGSLLGACLNYVDEFWQLYAQCVGVPMRLFGVLGGGCMMLPGLLALQAPRLERRFGSRCLLTASITLAALGLAGLWLTASRWGLVWLAVVYLAHSLVEPVLSGQVHARAESGFRATAESLQSLLLRLSVAAVGIGFGLVADRSTIRGGFGFLAVLLGTCVFVQSIRGLGGIGQGRRGSPATRR